MQPGGNILEIRNLSAGYRSSALPFNGKGGIKTILHNINLDIGRDEFFGVLGESGCGKSTLAKAVLGLLPHSGSISLGGSVQAVFQDPLSSLDPRHTVGFTVEEPLAVQHKFTKKERELKADAMLEKVGLDSSYRKRLPAELSGGQRQRVCIAAALITEPKLLVADEAISSLDVSVGAQILNLFRELHEQLEFAMMFISHNLDVVYYLCSRVAVMRQGRIVETGPVEDVYARPHDDYTRQLLGSYQGSVTPPHPAGLD
ncbi:MAG: ATP-binding cassette domain-containing protein [Treponema sp.]|nr:ATP-binding cassette domain-containing protein [Treponema sp.]